MPGKAAHPLATHRVPLVSHRARPYLGLFKRFLYFLPAGQKPNVGADLVRRGPKAAQPGDHVSVNLPGVSLSRHDEAARESRLSGDQRVKTLDLLVVTVKQLDEGGLAWVPVVPFTPRNLSPSLESLKFSSSMTSS